MEGTQEYFNTTQVKALATSDKNANPNVSFCGTAYMVDEKTIVAASVAFEKTKQNIQETNKAVFLAFKPLSPEYYEHLNRAGEQLYPAGYRYYCTLRETTNSNLLPEDFIKMLTIALGNRVENLKHFLVFDIDEIRKVTTLSERG